MKNISPFSFNTLPRRLQDTAIHEAEIQNHVASIKVICGDAAFAKALKLKYRNEATWQPVSSTQYVANCMGAALYCLSHSVCSKERLFEMTGIQNAPRKEQLANFAYQLNEAPDNLLIIQPPKTWFDEGYAKNLRHKMGVFQETTKTKK